MELASIIQDNIAKVDECIISNSLEPLSFEVNATLHQNLPKEVLTARDAAIEAMDELSQLLLGSLTSIIQRAFLGVQTHLYLKVTSLNCLRIFRLAILLVYTQSVDLA